MDPRTLAIAEAERLRHLAERTQSAERSARTAETLLRETLELLPEAVVLMDKDDRFIVWNGQYERMFPDVAPILKPGISYEEVLRASLEGGEHAEAVTTGEDESWLRQRLADNRAKGGVQEQRFRDGRWIRYDQRATPDGGTIAIRSDITEMKLREESFRLLFDQNPVPMLVFDRDALALLAVNDVAVETYGYSREQFLAMTLPDMSPPHHRQELIKHLNSNPALAEVERDWIHAKADGTQTTVCVYSRSLIYAGKAGVLIAIVDVTERRRQEERIRHLADHDPLTGLPNRLSFGRLLEQALGQPGRRSGFAVLLIDIDDFKSVNDTLGHAAGDKLIAAAAIRLRNCVRHIDAVARLGGDEFAVILAGMTHPDAIEPVVRRMVRAFAEPFDIEGHSVTVGASAGITLVPRDGDEQDAILRKADLALYQAKAAGRGTHRFFEPQMQLRLLTRRALEADLRAAVKDKAFEIHYQPVVQLESGSPIGFEALLRWRHKERGMLLPSDFIPIAEDSGLIVPIGAWVLARACADAMTWRDDLKLAVNLSSAQFRAGDIVGAVTAALNASRLDPRRLELEINEFVLLGQSDRNLTMLNEIERLGCSIIMDDFGTGFSSLSHLRAFPIGTIKIDRSFVPDMSSKPEHIEIIRAVLALGKSLGKRVIAEGIESEAQLALLLKLGCKEGQGLYFGAPEPASSISRLLKRTGARAPVAISGRMG